MFGSVVGTTLKYASLGASTNPTYVAKFAASVGLTLEDYIAIMEELHQERLKEEQDFMSKNFISVNPDDLASECLKIMAEKKIGCLAVMQDKSLVGIINQKDLVKLGI